MWLRPSQPQQKITRTKSPQLTSIYSHMIKPLTVACHSFRGPNRALIRRVFGRAVLVLMRTEDQLIALPRMRATDANSIGIIFVYPYPPIRRFSVSNPKTAFPRHSEELGWVNQFVVVNLVKIQRGVQVGTVALRGK